MLQAKMDRMLAEMVDLYVPDLSAITLRDLKILFSNFVTSDIVQSFENSRRFFFFKAEYHDQYLAGVRMQFRFYLMKTHPQIIQLAKEIQREKATEQEREYERLQMSENTDVLNQYLAISALSNMQSTYSAPYVPVQPVVLQDQDLDCAPGCECCGDTQCNPEIKTDDSLGCYS